MMKAEMLDCQNQGTGLLPGDWRLSKLSDIADINPGRTKPESEDDEVSFLAMGDVSEEGRVIGRQTRNYQDVAKGFTSFVENDVLVAKITPCFENGKGALATNLLGGIGFGSTEFHVIRAKEGDTLPSFLHFHTRDESFRKSGERNMVGSAGQKRVPADFLREYKIALPPIREQQKIVAILTTVDDKLEVIACQIEATHTLKRGLMQTLFSQGVGTQDADGRWVPHTNFKDSELGTTPTSWQILPQGDVATFHNGRAYKLSEWEEDGTPVIRLQNLTGSGEKYYYSNLKLPAHQYVEKGELLYMWSASFGPHIWSGDRAIYHYHIWKVECGEHLDQRFMYYSLATLTETMRGKMNGSTMAHLTKAGMEKQLMVVPSLSEQKRIAEILSSADAKLDLLLARKARVENLKRGLMQKLLTGEWRVKPEDAELLAA
ncbi:restriction endonuclease subunit S [Ralstonia pseudosolanacearum]|uniref:restriction endonuclease subunit S n=1 Tax=Ralstonia pseudosolanacearum TaxID=1310165 RepID=UPI003AAF8B5F